jgi:hypothetical protein
MIHVLADQGKSSNPATERWKHKSKRISNYSNNKKGHQMMALFEYKQG